jgi:hypothetical protein
MARSVNASDVVSTFLSNYLISGCLLWVVPRNQKLAAETLKFL